MGTLICPEFNPTLKPQAQAFKEGFKQSMSGLYTSVTDACSGFSSAVAAFAFWLSLAPRGLHFSVSKSILVMSASESCPARSGGMHNFLADTNLFSSFFSAVLEAAGHKLLSLQYHYFHTTGCSQLEQR